MPKNSGEVPHESFEKAELMTLARNLVDKNDGEPFARFVREHPSQLPDAIEAIKSATYRLVFSGDFNEKPEGFLEDFLLQKCSLIIEELLKQ